LTQRRAPRAFRALLESKEMKRWKDVLKHVNIKLD
jgi:hypothetical protein